jgi:hypothetical protein
MLDITTLAAWGEFIGGIAVVVSLIYLASQIRMNTKTVRASNLSGHIAAGADWNRTMVDPAAASLYVRGLEDFVGLSAEDQVRFNGLIAPFFMMTTNARHLRQQGLFDAEEFGSQENSIARLLKSRGVRQWWTANRHWWQPEFRDFVDGLIREGEAAE